MDTVGLSGLRGRPLRGEIRPGGDKSINHRALILASLACGESRIRNLNRGRDVDATVDCLQRLGVTIGRGPDHLFVRGQLEGHTLSGPALVEPEQVLDCGNSGTTMRLLIGLLAGQDLFAVLSGDRSLSGRPMGRITRPLEQIGARIEGRAGGTRAPLAVRGRRPLKSAHHRTTVPSAQVKSALILAGLFADGMTTVTEPSPSRDHTERMLAAMGARVDRPGDGIVTVTGPARLEPLDLTVPGDISSAAFPLAAALLVPGSRVVIRDVGLNPGRTGMIAVLTRAGACITVRECGTAAGEPVGDIEASFSSLGAFTVTPDHVPSMIDEIPVLCLLASAAHGTSHISGLGELRVKESDRLAATVDGLRALGVTVEDEGDGLFIHGPAPLLPPGNVLDSGGDHRMAMTWAVASLVSAGPLKVLGRGAVSVSYPGFERDMAVLGGCDR